ncbi:LuxR family transcriptional regulator [Aeromonas hydrophila]|uniref:LuxR family transcriptional regulator n=1 Tax=Aeromonas hydrophila TaxID=644 RepID=UPI0020B41C33|nr:LuxR family transcriptional regulator [Aeromonas hydrophila]MCP3324493.1 LuxR family transcriptional regulator [Aeromonas hydrophila]
MKKAPKIVIWENCDHHISAAIRQFEELWLPYSVSSRRYPILRLIKEVLDQAVNSYIKTLPANYTGYLPGAAVGVPFSEIVRLVGLEAMVRMQRQLLRQFIKTEDQQTARDLCFVATLESLIGLVWCCACKSPKRSTSQKGVNLNKQRKHGFCEFCGNMTEFATFMATVEEDRINNSELEDHKKLELSHQYCREHRPKLVTGEWNPLYRRAKRSLTQFNIELTRLTHQCANRSRPNALSGDELIDQYFLQLILRLTLQPADEEKLRHLARRMVDSKLSDTKKKMLVLRQFRFNQTEIGQRILNAKKQPITRQAVSKALASVRKEFQL